MLSQNKTRKEEWSKSWTHSWRFTSLACKPLEHNDKGNYMREIGSEDCLYFNNSKMTTWINSYNLPVTEYFNLSNQSMYNVKYILLASSFNSIYNCPKKLKVNVFLN